MNIWENMNHQKNTGYQIPMLLYHNIIFTKKDLSKIIEIDYLIIIKDDIRNCRVLNIHKLEYIKKLPSECKDELISIFNDCLTLLNEVMETIR